VRARKSGRRSHRTCTARWAPSQGARPCRRSGELTNNIPASERWAVDSVVYPEHSPQPGTTLIVSDIFDVELPDAHFDGIWVSELPRAPPDSGSHCILSGRRCTRSPPGGSDRRDGPEPSLLRPASTSTVPTTRSRSRTSRLPSTLTPQVSSRPPAGPSKPTSARSPTQLCGSSRALPAPFAPR
jgi:hypothetical protein